MAFKQLITLATLALLFVGGAHAQTEIKVTDPGVSINDNSNNTPDHNTILDVNSSNKAVIFPRMTTIQRDTMTDLTPGLLIFNSDNCVYEYFNGSNWQVIGLIPVQDAPMAPGNPAAEMLSETQISLTWDDNSENESGFEIWHSHNSATLSPLGQVAKNETSYIHTSQSPGYHVYQIRSLNGCSKSDFSAEAGVMLLDFDRYGETFLELRSYDKNKFVINSSYPGTSTHYRQWLDASENSLNFTQDDYLKQFQLVDSDVGNSIFSFQQKIVGLPKLPLLILN